MVDADPEEAYEALLEERKEGVKDLTKVDMTGEVRRSRFTWQKKPMLDAVLQAIEKLGPYLPISLRAVH